jgi:transcriptional regulator with XRE-family HTH domain
MSPKQVKVIADQSGVSLGNLLKIRNGQNKNPGIETVRAIYPFLAQTDGN